jgi:O-methyltransferase involved in polyketide biosynthesis
MIDRKIADRSIRRSIVIDLDRVSETLLWTLYNRALEARRPDTVLPDPLAVGLVDAIDYPFEQRFGPASLGQAQWQALRALRFDWEVRRFLGGHPDGTVVPLGEGLETQFWRVDNGRVRWLTVELPQVVELRGRLLPDSPRLRSVACSALDEDWLDEVDPEHGVLVTAQGLLMYLQPHEVHGLVAACAERFPGACLVFDAVPRWFSALALRGAIKTAGGYVAPPMPWGLDAGELQRIRAAHRNVSEVRELRLPPGRGLAFGYAVPLLTRIPAVRRALLTIWLARFGSQA